MRRSIVVIIALGFLAAVLGVLFGPQLLSLTKTSYRAATERVMGSLERWLAERLRTLADDALVPEVAFTRLSYRAPATVTLHEFRVRAEDETFIEADELRIELTDVPRRDGPFVIESISLLRPVVRLIERPDGALLGFDRMVEPSASDSTSAGSSSVSDHFAFRRLEIEQGTLRWEPDGREPMVLDGLDFRSEGRPSEDPGRYELSVVLKRGSIAQLAIDGVLDLDGLAIELAPGRLDIDLDPDDYRLLPPRLQDYVREHEVQGHLDLALTGRIPFTSDSDAALDYDFELTGADARFGEWTLPLQEFVSHGTIAGESLDIATCSIEAFDGTANVHGLVWLDERVPVDLEGSVDGMRLERLLATMEEGEPKYAGRFVIDGRVQGDLAALEERFAGGCTVSVTEGRLTGLPIVGALVGAISSAFGQRPVAAFGDSAEASIVFEPGRFHHESLTIISASTLMRGTGDIHTDGRLDLRVNAGPMERIQAHLGPVGSVLGALTDTLVKYHVHGTMTDVRVTVRPLGI